MTKGIYLLYALLSGLKRIRGGMKKLHGNMAMCAPIHMPGEYVAAIREACHD